MKEKCGQNIWDISKALLNLCKISLFCNSYLHQKNNFKTPEVLWQFTFLYFFYSICLPFILSVSPFSCIFDSSIFCNCFYHFKQSLFGCSSSNHIAFSFHHLLMKPMPCRQQCVLLGFLAALLINLLFFFYAGFWCCFFFFNRDLSLTSKSKVKGHRVKKRAN